MRLIPRVGGTPLHSAGQTKRHSLKLMSYNASKRAIDIVASAAGIAVLSPFLIGTAIAIRLDSPGPILFRQRRVGQLGECFDMWKFRSMYIDAEQRKQELLAQNESTEGVIFKMKDDPRVTRVGRFIRKLSIDELPQLWNVLCGDLTLVGPRPPLISEVREYTIYQQQRLRVKPGLTCIWQVSGRSDVAFPSQVEMDLNYVRNRNIIKDGAILAKTVPAVISGKGAY